MRKFNHLIHWRKIHSSPYSDYINWIRNTVSHCHRTAGPSAFRRPDLTSCIYCNRIIWNHISGWVSVVYCCSIDKRFEWRAGLPFNLSYVIESVFKCGIWICTNHSFDLACLRIHDYKAHLNSWCYGFYRINKWFIRFQLVKYFFALLLSFCFFIIFRLLYVFFNCIIKNVLVCVPVPVTVKWFLKRTEQRFYCIHSVFLKSCIEWSIDF